MKFAGREFKKANIRKLTITREGEKLVLTFQPSDMERFELLYPEPKPRKMRKRNSTEWIENRNDPKFKEELAKRNSARLDYMAISSLEASQIEWDSVNIDDPETWSKWRDDFKESGFTNVEINRVFMTAMQANSIGDEDITEAEEDFLAMEQEMESSEPIQTEGQPSI